MQTSRSSATGFIETGAIDSATERDVERLRFAPETEAEFQTYFIQRSLPRARWATAIYLTLVAVVTEPEVGAREALKLAFEDFMPLMTGPSL